jgi:ribosomal 30S subunit maturation factor RimM
MQSIYGEIPLPVIDDVIKEVDINNKKIFIDLLDGLIDIAMK